MVGYSGTPLAKKLGIKANHKIYTQNAPENYRALLEPLPENVVFLESFAEKADMIHIFAERAAELETALLLLKDKIKDNGAIWVSWYKKAAKIPTDITEDVVRDKALPLGLVDIKVCAVDEKWSGLKLVIRVENRRA